MHGPDPGQDLQGSGISISGLRTWPGVGVRAHLTQSPVSRPTVTVVMCCYSARRLACLADAAAAMRSQLSGDDELLIVVDGGPALVDMIRAELGDVNQQLRLLRNVEEPGLAGARNTGSAAARGEIVVFLDDDAVPRADWLEELLMAFSDATVIGVGGSVIPRWMVGAPHWLPAEFLWVVGCSYRGQPPDSHEVRNPIGANMAFRRGVLSSVGGFTNGIGRASGGALGCEETEFAIRAVAATGGRVVLRQSAVVDHVVEAERTRFRYFVRRCWDEGRSKAMVSGRVGTDAALASERTYVARTLPAGVLRGMRAALLGDPSGIARAAAIIVGLAVTSAGYAAGSSSSIGRRRPPGKGTAATPVAPFPTFRPAWVGELDLAAPSLPPRAVDEAGLPLARARLLVRHAGTPLGLLDIELSGGTLDASRAVNLAKQKFDPALQAAMKHPLWASAIRRPVSVAVCTRDRPQGLRRTIESLLRLKHVDFEIIVVDSASRGPETEAIATDFHRQDARVRYVREPLPGLSKARNRAVAEARNEIIAFTDDDVTVDPHWLNGILRGFEHNQDIACVTGSVVSASLSRPEADYFERRIGWSSSFVPRVFTSERTTADSFLHPFSPGNFGTGANLACRRSALLALGGFDECLGAGSRTRGGEDLDIFVRLLTAGYALSYEPSALVWHDHRLGTDALRDQMYAYGLGLSAYLTKFLIARSTRRALIRRALPGCWRMLKLLHRIRQSRDGSGLRAAGLGSAELRGMVAGPFVYLAERRHQDPAHVRAVQPTVSEPGLVHSTPTSRFAAGPPRHRVAGHRKVFTVRRPRSRRYSGSGKGE